MGVSCKQRTQFLATAIEHWLITHILVYRAQGNGQDIAPPNPYTAAKTKRARDSLNAGDETG